MTPQSVVADTRRRLVVAATLVVALLPWFPYPGRTVADTKIDLVLDPWSYLGRAQSAWDSHAFFGQLQNQAYGYLFPMGPFFGITRSLGIPEWMCQRLWWSLVLVTAFLGCYLLVRRLGLAGPRVAILVAFAFAASPRMLTVLGPISIEGWPSAMTPWLVLGAHRLLHAQDRGQRRRAAALLGLSVVAIGGVNATATIAALVVPTLYLMTAGRRGLRALAWWIGAVVLGTLWWLVPLVVLGAYAFPFLDFIESSSITTAVTSIPNVLRGTSHWVAFVPGHLAGGAWPAGSQLVGSSLLLAATTAVAVGGLCSLLVRRWWAGHGHVRTFAIVSIVLGVVGMGIGFGANLDIRLVSPVAGEVRDLLDGSLAALRNVHKFDPMVRLPVCLALAVGISSLVRTFRAEPRRQLVVVGAATLVIVVAALPAFQYSLAPNGSFTAVPDRWRSAATFVDTLAERDGGSTLVAPASRFGDFIWGDTEDDPLEALASSPIVNRDAIPLGNPGAIRQMDALDGVLSAGTGSEGLIGLLTRAGIARVVVPHDYVQHQAGSVLDPAATGTADQVERALRGSGLTLERAWDKDANRLSVWSTGSTVDHAEVMDVADAVGVTGGPEAVVQLATAGELDPHRPYVVTGSGLAAPEARVQTDTLKKRLLDVSRDVRDQYSDTLQSDDARRSQRRSSDFPPAGDAPPTTRAFRGITHVRASSTSADPASLLFRGASNGVAAAFDADYETSWISGGDRAPSISFKLTAPTKLGTVAVRVATLDGVGAVERVDLTVDGVTTRRTVTDPERDLTFAVDRVVQSVRVKLVPAKSSPSLPVGIANIAATGLPWSTGLQLPATESGAGQVVVSRDPWTTVGQGRAIDDGRVLTRYAHVDGPRRVGTVVLRARATAATEALLDGWKVSGPRWEDDPRTRPGAALDRDKSTRWTVGYLSGDPRLTVDWDAPRTITGLAGLAKGATDETTVNAVTITDPETGATREWTRRSRHVAPLTARSVVLTIHLPKDASFPFSIPDLTIKGVGRAPSSQLDTRVDVPCADGAIVDLGAAAATYSASATRRALMTGTLVTGTRCAGDVPTSSGNALTIRGESGPVLEARTIATADGLPAAAAQAPPQVARWTNRARTLDIAAAPSKRLVVWHEGFNQGWTARMGGRTLRAVEVDGWRQAFIVPAGSGGVLTADFAPDRTYRGGLVVGGLAVLLLLALAVWPARRGAATVAARQVVARRPTVAVVVLASLLAVGVGATLGGWAGAVLGLVAVLVPRDRLRPLLGVVVGLLLVAASARWVLPSPSSTWSVVPQALGLLLVCLLTRELGTAVGPSQDRALDPSEGRVRDCQGDPERQGTDEQR